jgi:hypothetical protein
MKINVLNFLNLTENQIVVVDNFIYLLTTNEQLFVSLWDFNF